MQVTVNGTAAPLYYVSPGQVDFQIPYSTPAGSALVQVTSNGVAGVVRRDYRTACRAQSSHLCGCSRKHARCGAKSGLLDQFGHQLRREGSYLTAYLIGSGPLDNAIATGAAATSSPISNETLTTTATVGSAPATVTFAGMAPGFVGLMQVDLQTPNVNGNVPLQVQVGSYAEQSGAGVCGPVTLSQFGRVRRGDRRLQGL